MRGRTLSLVLAAALSAAAGACGPGGTRTIELSIEHSRFLPDGLDVAPGESVRFVIRNDDPIDHEFILGPRWVQVVHEVGHQPHHAKPGEVSVPAGQEAVTTYTFPEESGALPYGCHLPGHWDYGMRGSVRIG